MSGTGTSSKSLRIASAQARISSPALVSPNSSTSEGRSWARRRSWPLAVTADLVGASVDQFADTAFDLVADLAHLLERLASGVVDFPVLDAADHIWAAALAVECDRLVRVELHLELDLLGLAVGNVDADLAHCLDDVRPDLGSGLLSG